MDYDKMIEVPDIKIPPPYDKCDIVTGGIMAQFMPNNIPTTFIECGANDGIHNSIGLMYEFMKWKCINIEANPYCFEELKRNRPRSLNLNYALGADNGTTTFSVPTDRGRGKLGGGGSIEYPPEYWEEQGRECISQEVAVRTYSSLLREHNIKEVGAMVLDIEGHELHVLRTWKITDPLPWVLCIEYPKIDNDEMATLLGNLGYEPVAGMESNIIFRRNIQ